MPPTVNLSAIALPMFRFTLNRLYFSIRGIAFLIPLIFIYVDYVFHTEGFFFLNKMQRDEVYAIRIRRISIHRFDAFEFVLRLNTRLSAIVYI